MQGPEFEVDASELPPPADDTQLACRLEQAVEVIIYDASARARPRHTNLRSTTALPTELEGSEEATAVWAAACRASRKHQKQEVFGWKVLWEPRRGSATKTGDVRCYARAMCPCTHGAAPPTPTAHVLRICCAGLKQIHSDPPIFTIDNFLTDDECARLIETAGPLLQRSKTHAAAGTPRPAIYNADT